jgi:hypothetical protein
MQVDGQVTGEPLMEFNQTRKRDRAAWPRSLPELSLESAGSSRREAVENLVAERFARQHDAQIKHFLPLLLGLRTGGRFAAVAGLRPAGNDELFVEQYFDRLAEQEISLAFQTPVHRGQVVEIGNLVATEAGAGYLMFACLAPLLKLAGFRWVICTATPQVENMLQKMDFDPLRLCAADPDRLSGGVADWGRYYETRPNVIAGDVHRAGRVIDGSLLPAQFRHELSNLALQLQQIRKSAP